MFCNQQLWLLLHSIIKVKLSVQNKEWKVCGQMAKYFIKRSAIFAKLNGHFMELVNKILIKWSEKGHVQN